MIEHIIFDCMANRWTEQDIIDALNATGGNMLAAARWLDAGYSTVRVRVLSSKKLSAIMRQAKATALLKQAEALTAGNQP